MRASRRPLDPVTYAEAGHILGVTASSVRRRVPRRSAEDWRSRQKHRTLSRADVEALALRTYPLGPRRESNAVEPSMSENNNVTVPVGSSTMPTIIAPPTHTRDHQRVRTIHEHNGGVLNVSQTNVRGHLCRGQYVRRGRYAVGQIFNRTHGM
jgi:hypothetical protein